MNKRRRKRRAGEFTCFCSAYRYPHRFGGGRCTGEWIANETWESNYGSSSPCDSCRSLSEMDDMPSCDVYSGIENIEECEAWAEFVQYNEIKIYGR